MTAEQKNLFAGERLIGRYGCFGCHDIPGFENAQPIGTELTEAGSKLLVAVRFRLPGPIEHIARRVVQGRSFTIRASSTMGA